MTCRLSCHDGGYSIEIESSPVGDDLLVRCSGGERPHIGAVAVATPGQESGEAEVQLIVVAGHREDELAGESAARICSALGCTVTFVAGMHWDKIDRDGIDQVLRNVDYCVDGLLKELAERGGEADA